MTGMQTMLERGACWAGVLAGLLILVGCVALPRRGAMEERGTQMDTAYWLPKSYACDRTSTPIVIDGDLTDEAWKRAEWTDDFVDIEGDKLPPPPLRTRAKMLWDDTYFYVAAVFEEPHVTGFLTQKNSVIYHDNDFEIFIDPDGDNHNYYEFEMNALNTIWELTLPKPYRASGQPRLGTNLPGLKTAVKVDGTINDPSDEDVGWTVEIAIPWEGLATYCQGGRTAPPRDGDQWRVNFSRVEWLYKVVDGAYRKVPKEERPEDNWVWSPQGVIDMHRPWYWGVVEFREERRLADVVRDPVIEAQQILMLVYEGQHARRERGQPPARTLRELGLSFGYPIRIEVDEQWWQATMPWRNVDGELIECQVTPDQRFLHVPARH